MTRCSCGASLFSEVGAGFIISPEEKLLWMRRRSDSLVCSGCGQRYLLTALVQLVDAAEVREEPPSEKFTASSF